MKRELALFTDLYELTMMQAYYNEHLTQDAVFSLFVRRLPHRRNYLIACGLDTILHYLETVRFSDEDCAYLASLGIFADDFLTYLKGFRFTGDVYAVREGTPIFPNEPIIEVVAPLPVAQIVETFVMNQIHVQTVLASKAQRVVTAADGRSVVDFGPRRMHGIDAALKAARAFYIGGVTATSNVLAGRRYGVPVAGTMAHSYIQAHESEPSAFRAFIDLYPETTLLVDTYDTLDGVQNVIDLARESADDFAVKAIRLDSGDLGQLANDSRKMLDDAGLKDVEVFASGGLDEYAISNLVADGAPIDGFGVGTRMGVSSDAPDLDIAYKLCEYAGKGRLKFSSGKPILPGRKQVFRHESDDSDVRDVIGRANEDLPGRSLLTAVMQKGERLPNSFVSLKDIRSFAITQLSRLPERIRQLAPAEQPYEVKVSDALSESQRQIASEASGT